MKKKLLAGLLLATLAIGTLSPTSSEAATKKATTVTKTKTPTKKTPTKVDGVKISDLLTGKYNDISLVKDVSEYSEKVIISKSKYFESIGTVETTHTYGKHKYWFERLLWQKRVDEKGKETIVYDGTVGDFGGKAQKWNTTVKGERSDGTVWAYILGSREEESSIWKLDPSRFKTTSTKVTDKKITIKGTYTLTPPKAVSEKVSKKDGFNRVSEFRDFAGLEFDISFWAQMSFNVNEMDFFKDVKCGVTLVFDRATKQIISLKIIPKLPENGYATNTYKSEYIFCDTRTVTFEHYAKHISQMTEEEKMINGKANKFDSVEVEFKCNYVLNWMQRGDYDLTKTIAEEYVSQSGFDLSRFKITSLEAGKNITTMIGTYKLKSGSNTLYDKQAANRIDGYKVCDDFDNVTADVTIVFDTKTKSMKNVTLQYSFIGKDLIDENDVKVDPEPVLCTHTFTFK